MEQEIRNEELKKEEPDMNSAPLDDAALEDVSGGATATGLIRCDWICPSCRAAYSIKQSPCPECGYES